jgi:hypothetical protein
MKQTLQCRLDTAAGGKTASILRRLHPVSGFPPMNDHQNRASAVKRIPASDFLRSPDKRVRSAVREILKARTKKRPDPRWAVGLLRELGVLAIINFAV